jgi:hypothetical protein
LRKGAWRLGVPPRRISAAAQQCRRAGNSFGAGDDTMTVLKGFLIVILSGIGFALGGSFAGYAMGVAMPGYFQAVFSSGRDARYSATTDPCGASRPSSRASAC